MRSTVVAGLAFAGLLFAGSVAFADVDCPPGSVVSGAACAAVDCTKDSDCKTNFTCAPMALCFQESDGARSGVVRQECFEGKCPHEQTCVPGKRCMTYTQAKRMNVLAPESVIPTVAPAAVAPPASSKPAVEVEEKKKPTCGCRAVGERTDSAPLALGMLGLGIAIAVRRRRTTFASCRAFHARANARAVPLRRRA